MSSNSLPEPCRAAVLSGSRKYAKTTKGREDFDFPLSPLEPHSLLKTTKDTTGFIKAREVLAYPKLQRDTEGLRPESNCECPGASRHSGLGGELGDVPYGK